MNSFILKCVSLGLTVIISQNVALADTASGSLGAAKKLKLRAASEHRGEETSIKSPAISADEARAQLSTNPVSSDEPAVFGAGKRQKLHVKNRRNDSSSSPVLAANTAEDGARARLAEEAESLASVEHEASESNKSSKHKFGASKKLQARKAW